MKKSLLIALAALTVMSANAQLLRTKKAQPDRLPVRTEMFGKVQMKTAQKAEGNFVAKPKKVAANKAYYYRPQGTFYVNWDSEGAGYIMPYLQTKPYQDLFFKNASTTSTAGSIWNYDEFNSTTQQRDTLEYVGEDFTIMYGEYFGMVPKLTTANGDSFVCTQGAKVDADGTISAGPAYGGVMSVVNTTESTGEDANWLANPHYYGSSDRFFTDQYGWTYYSGAPGPNYNPDLAPDDENQDRDGYWFGRNWGGEWNGFATAVEKPVTPYVLNRVYGWVTALKGRAFNVNCRVYRLDEMPQYLDGERNSIDPATFDDDHLIAHATTQVTSAMIREGAAILAFDLEAYDPDLDMDVQVTPEIDCPILIVMSGYDVAACEGLSFLVTNDEEEEGWGEFAYNLHCAEDGTILACEGLNNFFTSGEMKPGASIFMDVSLPYMIYNYLNETGEYTFPNEGGNYTLNDHEGISILSSSMAEDVYVELVDGSDVPEWLNIQLEDVYETYQGEQYWTGTFDAKVTCEPLPEGVEGREAKVKFYVNGAKLIYHFKQGNVVESKVYLIGDDPLGGWNPEAPIEMTEDAGVYTYTATVEEAKDIYFVFTEGIGSWEAVNGHRYGPTEANQDVVVGEDMTTQLSTNDQAAYKLAAEAGEYTITFNKNNMTFRVDAEVTPGVPGDANGDGQVDISDVNSVINQMLGKEPMVPACDMNGDGQIDISDVNAVINKMLGK